MADSYAYALSPKKIPTLFEKIRRLGVPDKGIDKWLLQAGFTSDTERRIKSVLRQVGFIDEKGSPTTLWREYRGADGAATLAGAIRSGYAELFAMYPDAQFASYDEVAAFITGNTSLSGTTVNLAVNTFMHLVALANFGDDDASGRLQTASSPNGSAGESISKDATTASEGVAKRTSGSPVIVNVNLELTLPESKDPAVYDALFGALAKHILQTDA